MRNVIFPSLPESRKIDPFWEKEAKAAESVGFGISLVTDANTRGPVIVSNKVENYLYRGWIVKPPYYEEMCQVAQGKVLNSYQDYCWTFNFPQWYKVFTNHETPESLTFTGDEIGNLGLTGVAKQVAKLIGNKPLIIKDWLKSRKHEWFDACFIKDASDVKESIRVMTNFFTLQGRDFYGGLVFREYLSLKKLGVHPKSGMPLPIEFRTFFLNGIPLITSLYWNNDIPYPTDIESPPQTWLEEIGRKMCTPFVALDIAQSEDGKWWVIEVNDGGSAGYPDNLDSQEFYGLLYKSLNK
jgi:ATP-grasp domain, R2K clade family 3